MSRTNYVVIDRKIKKSMDFELATDELKNKASLILDRAVALGATSALVEINEGIETGVDILKDEIENFETSYNSSLNLSIYIGKNKGSVGISNTNMGNVDSIVQHAIDLAKYTQADPDSGIASSDDICQSFDENLGLYNPINLSNEELINTTREIERIALNTDSKITNSNGSSSSYSKYNFVIASTNGLNQGYKTTRFYSSISLIGENKDHGMQTDYWSSNSRDFHDLLNVKDLATIAVSRTTRRLSTGPKINSGIYPIIFEASIAKSLIGSFLGSINGSNLYRNLSFLNNSINTQVFPQWLDIIEDPFIYKGLSSCYFDNEGVNVIKRNLVASGIVTGYQLNSYSARKLKMKTTGNSGGNHNISVTTNFAGDSLELAKQLKNGLIIIDTIGHGLNMVTGDYSVGASGLWIENGIPQYFVDNLTIAGNLKDIYQKIQYIGNDHNHGSIKCGSMLIDSMQVSS